MGDLMQVRWTQSTRAEANLSANALSIALVRWICIGPLDLDWPTGFGLARWIRAAGVLCCLARDRLPLIGAWRKPRRAPQPCPTTEAWRPLCPRKRATRKQYTREQKQNKTPETKQVCDFLRVFGTDLQLPAYTPTELAAAVQAAE